MSQILRTVFKINSRNFKVLRCYSANTSIKQQTQEQEVYETKEKINENASGKPKARLPLVKCFFVGFGDKELLAYPEVIERDDMETLKLEIAASQNYFSSPDKDFQAEVTAKDLEISKDLGLFGLNIPKEYDGKGYEWTQSLMASEPESNHTSLSLRLLSHRMVVDILKNFGTEEQKSYYLPKMATGSWIGTEALMEKSLIENNFFESKIEHKPGEDAWYLTAEKSSVMTKPLLEKDSTNLFCVLAANAALGESLNNPFSATLCLVEGSKVQLQQSTDGTKQKLSMDSVHLDSKNLISSRETIIPTTELMLQSRRLRSSMIALSLAKQITNETANHFNSNNLSGVPIKDLDIAKIRMANHLCQTYAIESMLYFSAGLMDEFFKPDVVSEVAAVKYYALRSLMNMLETSYGFVGTHNSQLKEKTDLFYKQVCELLTDTESMDTLATFIGLNGLHYAGGQIHEKVVKSRNPLLHPGYVISKLLDGNDFENPKAKLGLHENVHPTLNTCAQFIEHSMTRLLTSTEALLARHGNEVVERHQDIHRLAEISTEIFAMWCSVSRASRSYCIGLQNADKELLTASAICTSGRDKVKIISKEIIDGHFINNDNNLLRLGSHMSKNHGYSFVHPLSFNF